MSMNFLEKLGFGNIEEKEVKSRATESSAIKNEGYVNHDGINPEPQTKEYNKQLILKRMSAVKITPEPNKPEELVKAEKEEELAEVEI